MILNPPMKISARLMAAVQIGDTWISVDRLEETDRNGKPCWFYAIDNPAWDDLVGEGHDLHGWGDHKEMLTTLLSFLYDCAEARAHRDVAENQDLFPEPVGIWAEQNSEEIQCTITDLEDEEIQ